MNRFRSLATMFFVSVMVLALSPAINAQRWDKKTTVTFNQQIEIPGVGQQFLPAGTYVFKLVDSLSDRDIVQIFSQDEKRVFATILTIANYRLKTTNKTVMTFRERASGQPEAIRAWFYPGANWGQEFVYPKARAIEIAKVAQQPVLAMPTELAPEIVKPEPPLEALKEAPIKAVTPAGEEVEVAQVIPPKTEVAQASLPQTASSLPLLGLLGLLAIASGLTLWFISKRDAWTM
ncbi:MAG: LPXTG cell wall anchor domain-containing protein [Acidobacteria bacterium]|nr:LPXTG cell wall anchor domain-containing protein [Acidobacteriota bacterium]